MRYWLGRLAIENARKKTYQGLSLMSVFERRWFVVFYPRGGRGLDFLPVYAIDTQFYTQTHGQGLFSLSSLRLVFSLQVWNEALRIQTHTYVTFHQHMNIKIPL